ncbi:50S ribosomal protein L18e [Candidatus Woesearchaeota archaeon]|nr:50S ribosomal protein L18e [Candidatus Woesearchaeota archaeon]
MKRTGPTNSELLGLIQQLKTVSIKEKAGIWKQVATELEKPTRQRRVVNVSRLNHVTVADNTVVVPGKVLGTGVLNHKMTVAAYSFSTTAKAQIEKVKGKAISISDLLKENPKGKNVRIIG